MKKIFISYSKSDNDLLQEFIRHLAVLKMHGMIEPWYDAAIDPGETWDQEIKTRLYEADIILMLLSSGFMATQYIWEVDVKTAMERRAQGQVRVIPVVLRACDWQSTVFGQIQVLPKNGMPVFKWADRDEAWLDVVQGIRRIIEKMNEELLPVSGSRGLDLSSPPIPPSSPPLYNNGASPRPPGIPEGQNKILFLSASPETSNRLRVDIEYREVKEELMKGNHRDRFQLQTETAVQLRTLSSALMKEKPQIVHFSGHGHSGGLELEGETPGQSYVVPNEKLHGLFKLFKEKFRMSCVALCSCYSEAQAQVISSLGLYVTGMSSAVGDKAAIEFSIGFYQALAEGLSFEEAFELGKIQMTSDSNLPVLWYGGERLL
ncbi:MAG: toll/interleukin-1 receptor domain-containing protein [Saprospiraceae bacterium]|nr:toll/interleukin-1 receptor domain-containing protein [Saprospiraceae bacterium]